MTEGLRSGAERMHRDLQAYREMLSVFGKDSAVWQVNLCRSLIGRLIAPSLPSMADRAVLPLVNIDDDDVECGVCQIMLTLKHTAFYICAGLRFRIEVLADVTLVLVSRDDDVRQFSNESAKLSICIYQYFSSNTFHAENIDALVHP